ncbi:MAG TPA: hypothetical protein VLE47_01270 [Candidatus Saccharimonadales bacterium]|nr:hypothetical protein [Candidatus Saccharimonadales bacterium]
MKVFLKIFIPTAIVATILSGMIYAAVQQDLRLGANDPQIQMAEDTAVRLEANAPVATQVSSDKVDVAKSLAPFLIVYNDEGQVQTASVSLNGQVPSLPNGVLDYTAEHGQDRITWQPKEGVRIAAVVQKYKGGFVLAGRSLREIELREEKIQIITLLGWLVTIGALAIFTSGFVYFAKRKK